VLAWRKLQQRNGLSQQAAAQQARSYDESDLMRVLVDSGNLPPTTTGPDPLVTLQLLASGIVTLYSLVSNGAIVGHTDQWVTGVEGTPLPLRQAMARFLRQEMPGSGRQTIGARYYPHPAPFLSCRAGGVCGLRPPEGGGLPDYG
jgi:hypothetical protein